MNDLPELPDGGEWLTLNIPIFPDTTPDEAAHSASEAAASAVIRRSSDV